jgi:hypothetical protein
MRDCGREELDKKKETKDKMLWHRLGVPSCPGRREQKSKLDEYLFGNVHPLPESPGVGV